MPQPPPGFEWDDRKAAWNLKVFSFAAVDDFATALEIEGSDDETEEVRTNLVGKIKRQTYVFVFTRRAGRVRVISLRRATQKESHAYIAAKGY